MKHLVKRRGHSEAYDSRKLYASIYSSALSLRQPVRKAESLAEEVTKEVERWLEDKHEVTTNDIRRVAAESLQELHKDVGLQYFYHRVLW